MPELSPAIEQGNPEIANVVGIGEKVKKRKLAELSPAIKQAIRGGPLAWGQCLVAA
jgi:hypothetical protein